MTPKMFLDASVNYTQYRHKIGLGFDEHDKLADHRYKAQLDMKSGIFDVTGKAELHYNPTPQHDTRMGMAYTYHTFRPEVVSMSEKTGHDTKREQQGQPDVLAHETQLYVEDNMTVADALKMNVGLNYSTYTVGGRFYHSLEPRLSSRLLLTDNLSLKAGYAYMTQYVHMLSNSSISLPTDLWVPSTERILPEHAHQVAAGAYYELEGLCDLSVEGYYKHMNNLLEYREGSSFMAGTADWSDKVAMGRGWAYGLELMAQRSIGNFTGWVAYTWAKTMRQFDREGHIINGGRPFHAKYDRRHDINVTASYKFSERFDLSATWVYATGNCGTLYTHYYESQPHTPDEYNWPIGYFENRNNYRLEPYHRLDLSVNFHKRFKRHPGIKRTINISAYNAYNSKNPFLVYLYEGYNWSTDEYFRTLRKVTIFPIIPSVSYGIQF
jgi:outer membrane receptor for ferrienterochelin and colicin